MDYLAKLENFVLEYSKKTSIQTVWLTLRNIDETTRKAWCDKYRKNLPVGISFSQCMEFTKPWLDLQIQNLELDKRGDGTPYRPRGKGDRDWDRTRSGTPPRKGDRKGGGKGKLGKGGKGDQQARSRSRSRTPRQPRKPLRPEAAPSKSEPTPVDTKAKYGSQQIWVGTTIRIKGKHCAICRDYNNKGTCPRGATCPFENCCDAIPKGKTAVCGSKNHSRQDHNSTTVWYA